MVATGLSVEAITLDPSNLSGTFTYTPSAGGAHAITTAQSGVVWYPPLPFTFVAKSAMTTLMQDNFTGTVGTTLNGRVPDTTQNGSDVWASPGPNTGDGLGILAIAAGNLAVTSGSASNWSAAYPLTGVGGDQTVAGSFQCPTAPGGISWLLRCDSGFQNLLEVRVVPGEGIQISKLVAGTYTSNFASFAFTMAVATTYDYSFTVVGTTLTGSIGAATITATTVPTAVGSMLYLRQVAGAPGNTEWGPVTVSAPSDPTTATVTGPGTLTEGTPGTYTVTLDEPAGSGGVAFTPSATTFSASFSPSTVSIAQGQTTGTFTATSSTAGAGTITDSASDIAVTPVDVTSSAPSGPTTATITGPSTLTAGVISTNYTITLNMAAGSGGVSFTPSATVFAAAFSPTTVSIASGQATGTFTATSSTAGVGTITGTASGLAVNPASVTSAVPSAPSIAPTSATIAQLATLQLTASSFTGGAVSWTSSDSSVATVSGSGLVTAQAKAGTTMISAIGVTNPGQTASTTIAVQAVTITLGPPSTTVDVSGSEQFSATVNGTTNTGMTWSSSGGGTVNGSGLYSAPGTATTATVTVASMADGTKTATATVNVMALTPLSSAANFGPGAAGLVGTVGYAVYPYGSSTPTIARKTIGVVEILAGSGFYSATFSAPPGVDYVVAWDTGGATPTRAFDAIAGSNSSLATSNGTSVTDNSIQADVTAAMIALGYTGERATNLDNLDAAVSTRSTFAGGAVAAVTAPVTVGVNNDKLGYALSASGLDSIVVETGVNARQALAPILAASAGVVSGAGTGSIVIKGGNSTTTRIAATTDNAGNRSTITLNLPN